MITCVEPESAVLQGASRVQSTDDFWFRQLYRTHFDSVMRLVLRFGIGRHDAEDLTQRVFMVAHDHSSESEQIERPDAWLRAITVRVVRQHFRWWKVRRAGSWIVELGWAGRTEDDLTPEREVLAGESLDQVRDVLLRMSAKLREALVLLDVEDLSPSEAAELLSVPTNTLRSRRALAREEFKRLWERAQRRKGSFDE